MGLSLLMLFCSVLAIIPAVFVGWIVGLVDAGFGLFLGIFTFGFACSAFMDFAGMVIVECAEDEEEKD